MSSRSVVAGRWRRNRLRLRLTAIVASQGRSRSSRIRSGGYSPSARYARMKTSWATSSASLAFPVSRSAMLNTRAWCSRTRRSKAASRSRPRSIGSWSSIDVLNTGVDGPVASSGPNEVRLAGGLQEEDPDVPRHVAHDKRAQRDARRVESAPVGACDAGCAEQCEVAGYDMRARIGECGESRPPPSPVAAHQRRLHEAAPEELFCRTHDRHQARGDLASRSQRPERIDLADLRVATRDESPCEAIAQGERAVQDGCGAESHGDLGRTDVHAASRAGGEERHAGKPEGDICPQDQGNVDVVRVFPADSRRQCGDSGPRVFADVAPFVAVEDGRHQQPDRHRHDERLEGPAAGDREERAFYHQRAHEQEHKGNAQGAVLVLERRSRVEVAAGQAEETQHDDRRATKRDEVEANEDGRDERYEGEPEG